MIRIECIDPGSPSVSALLPGQADAPMAWAAMDESGQLIGAAAVGFNDNQWQLTAIAVQGEWQRKGIAKRLLQAIQAAGCEHGIKSLRAKLEAPCAPVKSGPRD